MKALLLTNLVKVVLGLLTPETMREFADTVLDWIEDHVEDSDAEWDDKVVLPLCNTVRTAFNIPDND